MNFKKRYFLFLSCLTLIFLSYPSFGQNVFFHLLGIDRLPPFYWTGLGANANWSNTQNWSTGAVPGATDTAHFTGTACSSNCSPTIDTNISVGGIDMDGGYTGTVTQSGAFTITIGSAGWSLYGGTFTGGTGNITFNASGIQVKGTSVFTATSGQTHFNQTQAVDTNVINLGGSATLTFPNSSTQKFTLISSCSHPIYSLPTTQKISFYNLTIDTGFTGCGSATFGTSTQTFEIRNDFNYINSTEGINLAGTFELYGNVISAGIVESAGLTFKILGSTNKTFTGPGGINGQVIVDKTGGATFTPINGTTTFTMSGLYLKQGAFTFPSYLTLNKHNDSYPNVLQVDTGTTVTVPVNSSLNIKALGDCGSPHYTIDVDATFDFQNLLISGTNTGCGTANLDGAVGDLLNVKKDLTVDSGVLINLDLELKGDLKKVAGNPTGAMTLKFTGAVTRSAEMNSTFTSGDWNISKISGILQLATDFNLNNAGQDLTVLFGTLDLAGHNLVISGTLTVAATGKLICNGGSVTAGAYVINGEVSCGTSIGITWTGSSGDHLWNNPANWTNNTVPGSTDTAIFNSQCSVVNCNNTVNTNISVKGLNITSSYNGTISQGTSVIDVGSNGWTQASGTFSGGSANITVVGGSFNLTGGTFTSTSATFTMYNSNAFTISGSPTFNHNSGTLQFNSGYTYSTSVTPSTVDYYNVTIYGNGLTVNLNNQTMKINGTLALGNLEANNSINSGTLLAKGNVTTNDTGYQGSALLKINGSTNQTITGISSAAILNTEIASTGGTVTFSGTLVFVGNYTYTSGTVNAGTSTLIFSAPSSTTKTVIPGSVSYNNVTFGGFASSHTFNGNTMNIYGTLTLSDTYGGENQLTNGTLNAYGNVVTSNGGKVGTAIVKLVGNSNQSINGSSGAAMPSLEIASTGGTVSFLGTIFVFGNYTFTSGVLNAGTSTLMFRAPDTQTKQIVPGTVSYNNVTFTGFASSANLNGGTFTVNGTLTLNDDYYSQHDLNNGTILAYGNVSVTGGGMTGNALIKIAGSGNQTVSGVSSGTFPIFEIASTGGTVTLSGTLKFSGNYTYTSGTVDSGTSTVFFRCPDATTASIIPGSFNYNNVTFDGFASSYNLNGGTFNVLSELRLSDNYAGQNEVNNGTLNVSGNVVVTGAGKTGTALINLLGSTASTLAIATNSQLLSTNVVVNKTGGSKVSLASNSSLIWPAGQSLNLTAGTFDLAGFDLSVNNAIVVGVGTTLKCSGGEFTSSTLTNNGTINCPGYSSYDFNWTGGGGNANWNTAANWSGGVVPGASDVASFTNSFCGANCNATINVDPAVRGVKIISPYTGTISQGSGVVTTIGYSGWKQAAGTFTGSNANFRTRTLKITGGTFTAPSTTLLVGYNDGSGQDFTVIDYQGGTFTHNNGTLEIYGSRPLCYYGGPTTNRVVSATGSLNFYNMLLTGDPDACYGGTVTFLNSGGGTLSVANNLTQDGGFFNFSNINLSGNLAITSRSYEGNISAGKVTMTSTGAQTYTYTGALTGSGPVLAINKTSGSVTTASTNVSLSGLDIQQGTFVAPAGILKLGIYQNNSSWTSFNKTAAGTFTHNNGTIDLIAHYGSCSGGSTTSISSVGPVNLYNVKISSDVDGCYGARSTFINPSGKINVLGDLTFAGGFLNGTWYLSGNYIMNNAWASGGSAAFVFEGSSNATLTASSGAMPDGTVTVSKTGGSKLTLTSNLSLNSANQDLAITSGTLDMAGFNLTVNRNITNNGVLQKGSNPSCGTLSYGGSYTGTAAVCP